MNNKLMAAGRGLLLTLALGSSVASAAAPYPNKPVRIVVGSTPGGVTDTMARVIGNELSKSMGQQFVVENRPGAGGLIGLTNVYKSPRDGYTLLMVPATLSVTKALYSNIGFDPVEDFVPVINVGTGPVAISVHSTFPAKNFKDFIAYAKTHDVNFASCGPGTPQHIAGEYLRSVAGLKLTHVPYKGCAAALTDVLGGSVPLFFATIPNIIENMKGGRIIPIAVTSAKRSPLLPNVPTAAESGFPDMDVQAWFGLVAAKGTPPDIINKINKAVNVALGAPDVREKMATLYMEPVGGTPEAFGQTIRTDSKRLSAIVIQAGIKVQ
jgi:tripartite-type tricarboxylate transporter receptor subunit TctC